VACSIVVFTTAANPVHAAVRTYFLRSSTLPCWGPTAFNPCPTGSPVTYVGTGSNFGSAEFSCQYQDSLSPAAKVISIRVTAPMSRFISAGGDPSVTISIGTSVVEQRLIATPPAECSSPSEVFQSPTYAGGFPGYVKGGPNTFRLRIDNSYGISMRDYAAQIEVTYELPPPADFAITSSAPEAERRILISNARAEYPHPHFQSVGGARDAEVTTYLRARDPNSGNFKSGLTVYLRILDPPDSAPYMNQAGNVIARNGDNHGAAAILAGTGITLHSPGVYQATSGANGQVDFTLRMQPPFAAGDNYQIEASLDPAFPTGSTARSATLTAWKRVFIEKRRMLRNGLFLAQDANAGDPFIITRGNHWYGNEGNSDELSKSEKIVITHAPQIDRSDLSSGWYYETHTILSVDDLNNGTYRVNLGTKQGKTVTPEPLLHDYKVDTIDGRIGDGISKIDTLTLGPDDYFDVSPDLITGEAFLAAFTENIFLSDAITPGALVPVPFVETDTQDLLQNLAEKWSSVVPGGTLLPNHQLLVVASDNEPHSAGNAAGLTITQAGSTRTSSYVFRHAIADQLKGKNTVTEDRWAMKTAAHEIAHQWETNGVWNLLDHCPETTKVYDDPGSYCLLADFDADGSGSVAQRTNGIARFHLLPLSGGGWHSEYLGIRRRSDPFIP
jgi:hypothetical protein